MELSLEPRGCFRKSFKGAVFEKGGGSQEDLKHILSFYEKKPVCYKSCLLTISVLLHEI